MSKRRVLLIATGGTIASTEDGSGLAPTMTGPELARQVPCSTPSASWTSSSP